MAARQCGSACTCASVAAAWRARLRWLPSCLSEVGQPSACLPCLQNAEQQGPEHATKQVRQRGDSAQQGCRSEGTAASLLRGRPSLSRLPPLPLSPSPFWRLNAGVGGEAGAAPAVRPGRGGACGHPGGTGGQRKGAQAQAGCVALALLHPLYGPLLWVGACAHCCCLNRDLQASKQGCGNA